MPAITFSGLQELQNELKQLPVAIGSKAKVAFNQFAEQVVAAAKPLTPYDPGRETRGGKREHQQRKSHLRDAYFIRRAESDMNPTVHLGIDCKKAPHAFLMHEGIAGAYWAKNYSEPGTGPKYIERPFMAQSGKVEKAIDDILDEVTR